MSIERAGKNDEGERFVAVLEISPVDSAQRAVQVQIVKDSKSARDNRVKWHDYRGGA